MECSRIKQLELSILLLGGFYRSAVFTNVPYFDLERLAMLFLRDHVISEIKIAEKRTLKLAVVTVSLDKICYGPGK